MTDTGGPPLRIGDADRDAAASALSEHFANGRLTKPEYDERLEAIWAARFDADLEPLFADLPGSHREMETARTARSEPSVASPARSRMSRAHMFVLAPLLVLGFGALAFAALRSAPWLLFIGFWLFACGGFGRSRGRFGHRHGYAYGHGHPHGNQRQRHA